MISGGMIFLEDNLFKRRLGSSISGATEEVFNEDVNIQSMTTERVVTFSFGRTRTINTIILGGTNFKQFRLTDSDGNLLKNIDTNDFLEFEDSELDFINENFTSYYLNFDTIDTDFIQLEVLESLPTYNIGNFLASQLIGSFNGYPTVNQFNNSRSESKTKSYLGPTFVSKRDLARTLVLGFQGYTDENDINLRSLLWNRNKGFIVYPCGALSEKHFNPVDLNWSTGEFFFGQTVNNLRTQYRNNIWLAGVNSSMTIVESIR